MRLTNSIRDAYIQAVMDDVPSKDYTEDIRKATMQAAIDALPPKVRAVWDDQETRVWVPSQYCHDGRQSYQIPGLYNARNKVIEAPQVAALVAARKAQDAAREALKSKLKGVAYACTTRKALADALPEFLQYLPPEVSPSTNLPALANVVTEFTRAGWPKSKKAVPA